MDQRFSGRGLRSILGMALGTAVIGFVAAIPPGSSLAQHSSSHSSGGHSSGGHSSGSQHTDGGHDTGSHVGGAHGGRKGSARTGGRRGATGKGRRGAGIEDKVLRPGRASASRDIGKSRSRPVWAGGAIPENLELGRLNVARAPEKVLDKALQETYATVLDKNGDNILDADADFAVIDSPRANLALYREAISGTRRVEGAWTLDQAALFLGKAADKNIAISTDTVSALDLLLEAKPDFSAFSYDRAARHPAELVAVFEGGGYTGTGIDAFAQAADDARAISLYRHDNR